MRKPVVLRALLAFAFLMLGGCLPRRLPTPAPTIAPSATRPVVVEETQVPLTPSSTATQQAIGATPGATALPPGTPTATGVPSPVDPFSLISQESLFGYMQDLSSIQAYSGWRNSASEGEKEALDYVAKKLGEMAYLRSLGLELERQSFRVYLGTEIHESRLRLRIGGREVEVTAAALRGDRESITQALRFDSDGKANDIGRNPVTVEGGTWLVRTADDVRKLRPEEVRGRVVFVDYTAIDRSVVGSGPAADTAATLVAKQPAGLVLVTQFSNKPGASHGSFVGDLSALNSVRALPAPPTLYARLEDLAPAGIKSWDDLGQVEAARMIWDADVLAPATSGNLMARIPGSDSSRVLILGAHIDSPNSPGAMDDGSGSSVLLEMARVLDAARMRPAIDVCLVWFGSEELGLCGSYHFVATHSELLDRAVAALTVDMLSRPLDGVPASLTLEAWPYGRLGDGRLPWPDFLAQQSARHGVKVKPEASYAIHSDNSAFTGLDVPNANLIYIDTPAMERAGGLHYAAHIHDPYETVELAREVGDVFEQMARVALAAIVHAGEAPGLRVTPRPERRAVFVASHTEDTHMGPGTFTDLGTLLAMEGFDVDQIPYGQPVSDEELKGAALVIVLPVIDYASTEGDPRLYDEAWTPAEVAALERYVAGGGLLVLTNSAHRLKYGSVLLDPNEDWSDVNALANLFGVNYGEGSVVGNQARTQGDHRLVRGVDALVLAEGNGVPFSMDGGQVRAQSGQRLVAAIKDHGQGQVLALCDVTALSTVGGRPTNLAFWQNLIEEAEKWR